MSKNLKERSAYRYLHLDADSVLMSVRLHWWRYNNDVGRMRKQRAEQRARQHLIDAWEE